MTSFTFFFFGCPVRSFSFRDKKGPNVDFTSWHKASKKTIRFLLSLLGTKISPPKKKVLQLQEFMIEYRSPYWKMQQYPFVRIKYSPHKSNLNRQTLDRSYSGWLISNNTQSLNTDSCWYQRLRNVKMGLSISLQSITETNSQLPFHLTHLPAHKLTLFWVFLLL